MGWKLSAFAATGALLTSAAQAQSPAPKPLGLDLKPCTLPGSQDQLRCGTFTVLENRAKPDGRRLSLKVIVVPARAAQPKEPIFVLSGGPGQAASEQAQYLVDNPQHEVRDVVAMDLRGTGEGTRLDCDVGQDDARLQTFVEPLFADPAPWRACRERLERTADLTQYTTPVSMQDLDELRAAMGYRQVYLYGGSYGSRAALAYIHAYGANVRGAFLSGIAPMEDRAPLYHAASAQRAFDRIVAQCRAEPACHAAYPDPQADLDAIRDALRRQPARVKVKHPATGAEGELVLSEPGFGDGLRVMLYSEETGRRVPLMLQRARGGDYAPFAQAAVSSGYNFRKALAMGLLLSVSCPEDLWRIRPEEIATTVGNSFIGDRRVRGQLAACGAWPKHRLPASFYEPFVSDVPVVLVSGDLDPVTPPHWGETMKRSFRHAVHIVVPGAHVSDNPCIDAITNQVFTSGKVEGLDTSCVAKLTNPPFVLPDQTEKPAASSSD